MAGGRPKGKGVNAPEGLPAQVGVTVLSVPTPFPVGRVNAYLLAGDPPALIDCGPNSARALLALERALAEAGVGVEELGFLLLTHQHVDHLGLAEAVVERSGAKVIVYERPGHSPSDTLFLEPRQGLLFGGDHLLAEISSNPVITPPAEGGERPRPLPTYLESL